MKKISNMKSLTEMTKEELGEYTASIKRYKQEQMPALMALTDAWEESDCKTYAEGLRLLTACRRARTFVGQAYDFQLHSRAARLNSWLDEIIRLTGGSVSDEGTQANRLAKQGKPVQRSAQVEIPSVQENGEVHIRQPKPLDWMRKPKHLDEWKDKMSKGLREKVDTLLSLHVNRAQAHNMLKTLSTNPAAAPSDIKYYANKVMEAEQAILSIYEEADKEWEVLQGKSSTVESTDPVCENAGNVHTQEECTHEKTCQEEVPLIKIAVRVEKRKTRPCRSDNYNLSTIRNNAALSEEEKESKIKKLVTNSWTYIRTNKPETEEKRRKIIQCFATIYEIKGSLSVRQKEVMNEYKIVFQEVQKEMYADRKR